MMMKHDKMTQRKAAGRVQGDNAEDDDDDIVRNMTNLILHKDAAKPWEQCLMEVDTAPSTILAGKAFKFGGKKKPLLSMNNKGEDSKINMFLNPAVESFLSFTMDNNQTGIATNNNVTNLVSPAAANTNIFD
jgi:hypothetical protein